MSHSFSVLKKFNVLPHITRHIKEKQTKPSLVAYLDPLSVAAST